MGINSSATTDTASNRMWRSRWAAVGAAVAVTLGAGGLVGVNAASNPAASAVTVTPCRLLDTRQPDTVNFGAEITRTIQVTGNCEVPDGATALEATVTAVNTPNSQGFLTAWASGSRPNTSSLNWKPTAGATANTTTIALAADGSMRIYTHTPADIIVDVIGYQTIDRANGAETGPQGPAGPVGPVGPQGEPGPAGPAGLDAPSMANVITVSASGGDFVTVAEAFAAISENNDNTAATPYVVQVGPGSYEATNAAVPDHTTVSGSGSDATTFTIGANSAAAFVVTSGRTVTLQHFNITNQPGLNFATAVRVEDGTALAVHHVDVELDARFATYGVAGTGGVGSGDVTITDSNFELSGGSQTVQLFLYSSNLTVNNSTFRSADPGYGIWMEETVQADIRHSTFEVGDTESAGIINYSNTPGVSLVFVASTVNAPRIIENIGGADVDISLRNSTLSVPVNGALATARCSNVVSPDNTLFGPDCSGR